MPFPSSLSLSLSLTLGPPTPQGGAVVDRLEGADAPALAAKTAAHAARTAATAAAAPPVAAAAAASPAPPPPPAAPPADSGAVARIKALLASCRVMLFMKGSPDAPRCGFSRRVVDALRGAGCTDFGSFDILSDEEVRTQLKAFSQWPTYPQLFVGGELLGGCDIVTEMAEGGELAAALKGGRGA